jgi:perosamine synthetase
VSSSGDYVTKFERALCDYIGAKHAVACNCGTSAIHIGLLLSGVRADDEVIVPTVTFIAPVNAARYVGAWPVFVDCDDFCNIDVEGIRRFLVEKCSIRNGSVINRGTGRRVSAVIPVHVFGTPVDMDPLMDLAREYGLAIVEDASESLGSTYKGRQSGGLAPIGCLSFNGNKIVTSGGGGALITNDDEIARQARYLTTQAKDAGIEYIHQAVGYNYRMNNVLAALGLAQLETLQSRLDRKKKNFALYEASLGEERFVQQKSDCDSNRWFYGFLARDPEAKARIVDQCTKEDIQVRPLWYPNHLQTPYADMESYEITRAMEMYDRVINLPCSVTLKAEEIDRVVAVIQACEPPTAQGGLSS